MKEGRIYIKEYDLKYEKGGVQFITQKKQDIFMRYWGNLIILVKRLISFNPILQNQTLLSIMSINCLKPDTKMSGFIIL
jgi:hypothetical protein